MICLKYLPPNQCWAWIFGDATLRLNENSPLFFAKKKEAIAEAERLGFWVEYDGPLVYLS